MIDTKNYSLYAAIFGFLIFSILIPYLHIPNLLYYSYYQFYIGYFENSILRNRCVSIHYFVYCRKKYLFSSSNHFIIILSFFSYLNPHYLYQTLIYFYTNFEALKRSLFFISCHFKIYKNPNFYHHAIIL
jgi:hypothetical protein